MTLTPQQIADGWKPVPDDLDTIRAAAWIEPMFRGPPKHYEMVRCAFGFAHQFEWSQDGSTDDIIAYREVQTP